MAVIRYEKKGLEELCGINANTIINVLTSMGMPAEEVENYIEIEVTPNRPDLLFAEGIARAIRQFLRIDKPKQYVIARLLEKSLIIENVEQRPYIAIAAVENIKNDVLLFESIIQAQEKIHETYGRKRKKVAIGIHDLSKIEFPITYKAVNEERFIPLGWKNEANIKEILEHHEKGKLYGHLVKEPFPMLYDKIGVISFPPIINSDRTKVTPTTSSFLIDVTGTNQEAVESVLDLFVTSLAYRGGEIIGISSNIKTYPVLKKRAIKFSEEVITKIGGIKLSRQEIKENLEKFEISYNEKEAIYPPYRIDVMDEYDVVEDILIGYGYENIKPAQDEFYFEGNKKTLATQWENIFIGMGFKQIVTFFIGDKKEFSTIFEEKDIKKIINPLTEEFNALRPSLLFNMLHTEQRNKTKPYPHLIFEIGKIFLKKETLQIGFLISKNTVKIEDGISVLKRFLKETEGNVEVKEIDADEFKENKVFVWSFAGKSKKYVFIVGVLHPKWIEKYGLEKPVVIGLINPV